MSPALRTNGVRGLVLMLGLAVVLSACGDDPQTAATDAADDRPLRTEHVAYMPGGAVGIADPEFHAADGDSTVVEGAPVIGLLFGGEARAYRVRPLESHHVVNDTVGDVPITVTYCILCRSAAVFEGRTKGHARLVFRCRSVWRGTMLMTDDQTGSVWTQLDGVCREGPLKGRRLVPVTTHRIAAWSAWRKAHPTTRIMREPDESFAATVEATARDERDASRPEFIEEILPTVEGPIAGDDLVQGVCVDSSCRGYSFAKLKKAGVVEDELAGVPVTVWFDATSSSAVAFDRRVGGRTLSFRHTGSGIRDRETGSRWSQDGRCVEGELEGSTLTALEGGRSRWFAWSWIHPDSELDY